MGRPQYRMIKLRTWTSRDQIPTGLLNYGHAALVDEFALHFLNIDKHQFFGSRPGCGISILDIGAKRKGADVTLQAKMKTILLYALVNSDCVSEQVSC